jgi:DNA mismatch repair protein MutL
MVGGVPVNNGDREAKNFITDIIEAVKNQDRTAKDQLLRTMAMAQARSAAIRSGQKLQQAEVNQLINDLFSCKEHTLTPDNKTIIAIISDDDISKRFR